MKRIVFVVEMEMLGTVCLAFMMLSVLVCSACQRGAVSAEERELRARFTVGGTPVHPLLVHQLEPWLSDVEPTTVVVDPFAARDSNQYFTDNIVRHGSWVESETSGDGGEWCGYLFLGSLRDGTLVIETEEYGRGSGVFKNVLFLRVVGGRNSREGHRAEARPMLMLVGLFSVGDRDSRPIRVEKDHVDVGGEVASPWY